MDPRGRKRAEAGELLPADKRACSSSSTTTSPSPSPSSTSSSEFRPSTSPIARSPPPPPSPEDVSVTGDDEDEDLDEDVDEDSDSGYYGSASASGRGGGVHGRLEAMMRGLSSADEGAQAAALAELAEMLLFTTVETIDCVTPRLGRLAPALVAALGGDGGVEVQLAAARAVFLLCDMIPGSTSAVVRHGAVPALCRRLVELEYVDVGEQCVKALEKISQSKPVQCLEAGAVMACLLLFDFFPMDVQKAALATVANMCKKISPAHSELLVDAVPILSGILAYQDDKLVETVAACLRRIAEGFSELPEKLDEMCNEELISQCVKLITSNWCKANAKTVFDDLMGILSRLASHSTEVVKTILKLDMIVSMRDILRMSCASTPTASRAMFASGHYREVPEVLKLLNQLLPPVRVLDEKSQESLAKEQIFVHEPHLLHQFAMNIFPLLIQVADSGTSSCVRYGCLSILKSIAYFSTPDSLLNILDGTNISSLLANLLSDKNEHLVVAALHIADILLQKHPDRFLRPFIKEGVVYAIDLLSKLDSAPSTIDQVPMNENSASSKSKVAERNFPECLCYVFDLSRSLQSQTRSCKAGKSVTSDLARLINSTYFASSTCSNSVSNEILNKLKTFCSILSDNVHKFSQSDYSLENEEYLAHILDQIICAIKVDDMSTFEFIESGIVKSFLNYLCNGQYLQGGLHNPEAQCHHHVVLERCRTFARIMSSQCCSQGEDLVLTVLVQKLQSSLSCLGKFPVVTSQPIKSRDGVYVDIPYSRVMLHPYFRVRFGRGEADCILGDYSTHVLRVDPSSSFHAIEKYLWSKIAMNKSGNELNGKGMTGNVADLRASQLEKVTMIDNCCWKRLLSTDASLFMFANCLTLQDIANGQLQQHIEDACNGAYTGRGAGKGGTFSIPDIDTCIDPKLAFYLDNKEIDRSMTLYQAIVQQKVSLERSIVLDDAFWNKVHKITYKKSEPKETEFLSSTAYNQSSSFCTKLPFFSSLLVAKPPIMLERGNPCCDILFLLRILEGMNKYGWILSSNLERTFSEEEVMDFCNLSVVRPLIPGSEFQSSHLSKKLEQQMSDNFSSLTGNLPAWFSWLMALCPFLFPFSIRSEFFRITQLSSFQKSQNRQPLHDNTNTDLNVTRFNHCRKKFGVNRSCILESAQKIMELSARSEAILEVEYEDEVGSGLGPTLEFYTLVSQAFQKPGLGLWRGDHYLSTFAPNPSKDELTCEDKYVTAPFGLFPRPWSTIIGSSNETQYAEVISNFKLLGWLVARAIYDGRILDLPLSKAFYKLILGQELDVYDILSFDPELGRTVLEFQSLVIRKGSLEDKSAASSEIYFRGTKVEDLCIDFTLPGYPNCALTTESDCKMVDSSNLEEFISLVVDATVKSGISRQMEAFKLGFNEVFPLRSLCIFSEEELECLLCGEQDTWTFEELLGNIKFDHGYTVGSSQVLDFLEVIQEFQSKHRRAFLQFVTGTPRLPPGGLAALNPKLTIVRKHVSGCADMDLPSVMTCANYLKLPPYSSKEKTRERLLYAIIEGQGSFHLS